MKTTALRVFFFLSTIFFFTPLRSEEPAVGKVRIPLALDLSIEELLNCKIETVSRREERLDDAPGSSYIVTAATIRRRGYTSLREVLDIIPGFAVFHKDLQYIGIARGLAANDNEKMTLLINGVEVNQVMEPEFLNGPINLDNVDRVEVVVGPSSMFRPANTLVATINVITKKGAGHEVIVAGGTEREYAITGMSGVESENGNRLNVAFTLDRRKGFDAWDGPQAVRAGREHDELKTTGKTDNNHFLAITGLLNKWEVQISSHRSKFPQMGRNIEAEYTDEVHGAAIKRKFMVTDEVELFTAWSAYYKRHERRVDIDAPWLSTEQWDFNGEIGCFYTGIDNHMVQAGIQALYEENMDSFYDGPNAPKQRMIYDDTYGVGFYVDDTISITDNMTLIAGIRTDHNTLVGSDWHWAGRLGASYRVSSAWISKIFANRTNRMPSAMAAMQEIWGSDAPRFVGYKGAERADKPEVLSAVEWTNIFYGTKSRFSVNVYYQTLEEYITFAGNGPWTNAGDYEGWGIELSEQYQLMKGLSIWANAATVQAEFNGVLSNTDVRVNEDEELIGSPQYTANLGVDWDVTDRILFSPQVRYFTRQPLNRYEDDGKTTYYTMVDNQAYVDVSFLFKDVVYNGLDVRLTGKNIFDNRSAVASPWRAGEYHPRGASVELAISKKF